MATKKKVKLLSIPEFAKEAGLNSPQHCRYLIATKRIDVVMDGTRRKIAKGTVIKPQTAKLGRPLMSAAK